jgi:hypothetical protein
MTNRTAQATADLLPGVYRIGSAGQSRWIAAWLGAMAIGVANSTFRHWNVRHLLLEPPSALADRELATYTRIVTFDPSNPKRCRGETIECPAGAP